MASAAAVLGQTSGVVTDASVPEGHRGLHEELYGQGVETSHATSGRYEAQAVGTCMHGWRGVAWHVHATSGGLPGRGGV